MVINEGQDITGRCYCGRTRFFSSAPPFQILYCHCEDCRRATGAPVAVFAAFREEEVRFAPDEGKIAANGKIAKRSFCPDCGTPTAGRYAYLPGQVYVAIGMIDQANELAPQLHANYDERLAWLDMKDDLECIAKSARRVLNES